MNDEQKEQPTRSGPARWTDSSKVIWGCFAVIGFLLGLGIADAQYTLRAHEQRIVTMEKKDEGNVEWRKSVDASLAEMKSDIKQLLKK